MATADLATPLPLDTPDSAGSGLNAFASYLGRQRDELAAALAALRMSEAPSWTSEAGRAFRSRVHDQQRSVMRVMDLLDSARAAAAAQARLIDEKAHQEVLEAIRVGNSTPSGRGPWRGGGA